MDGRNLFLHLLASGTDCKCLMLDCQVRGEQRKLYDQGAKFGVGEICGKEKYIFTWIDGSDLVSLARWSGGWEELLASQICSKVGGKMRLV